MGTEATKLLGLELELTLAIVVLFCNFSLCTLISSWMLRVYLEIRNSPSAYPVLWLPIALFVFLSGFSSLSDLFHNPWIYLAVKSLLLLTLVWILTVIWANRYDIMLRTKIIHELGRAREGQEWQE